MAKVSARLVAAGLVALGLVLGAVALVAADDTGWTLVGWNNLGMHCMDADFAVLLAAAAVQHDPRAADRPAGAPGRRTRTGITVTYEAVADPDGSINTTSAGKTNFWDYVQPLFGVSLPVDVGLAGMVDAGRGQRAAADDVRCRPRSWFIAEGIPITPYDDAAAQEPLSADAPGGAQRARAQCSRRPTSCCRSPTRWTARPATRRARGPRRGRPPAG